MTYRIYYSIFFKEITFILSLLFTQNVVISLIELVSAYFVFVEADHSSTLTAALSLL